MKAPHGLFVDQRKQLRELKRTLGVPRKFRSARSTKLRARILAERCGDTQFSYQYFLIALYPLQRYEEKEIKRGGLRSAS